MEFNPVGVLIIGMVQLILGCFAGIALTTILQVFNIIRFKKSSSFITWGVVVGITSTIIFWAVQCN